MSLQRIESFLKLKKKKQNSSGGGGVETKIYFIFKEHENMRILPHYAFQVINNVIYNWFTIKITS